MTRWEYLRVRWEYQTWGQASDKPTWVEKLWIRRPNEQEEELPDADFFVLFNELGLDGWELIAERVNSATVLGSKSGWTSASEPIDLRWTFKRPHA